MAIAAMHPETKGKLSGGRASSPSQAGVSARNKQHGSISFLFFDAFYAGDLYDRNGDGSGNG
jgi:hypothetical protein